MNARTRLSKAEIAEIAARKAADAAFEEARSRLAKARQLERKADVASRTALVELGKARAATMDAEQALRRAFAERAQLGRVAVAAEA
jgi:hypothetical protein